MREKNPSQVVMLPKFRMSFPYLLEAYPQKREDGTTVDEFRVQAIFPEGEELTELKQVVTQLVEEKWGKIRPKLDNLPIRLQAENLKPDGTLRPNMELGGKYYMNLKCSERPGVVDHNLHDVLNKEDVYPGRWARAQISVFTYFVKGKSGVSSRLRHVQILEDDERLDFRQKPEEVFSKVALEKDDSGMTENDLF